MILLSPSDDPETHGRPVAAGCDAVVYRDLPGPALGDVLRTALDNRLSVMQAQRAEPFGQSAPRLWDFVCRSSTMRRFIKNVQRIVRQDTVLLITGETGVGKEYLARAIHAESPRSDGPFIAVNCGALPESLLESELFGHEKGAFTGASRYHRGLFELAHGGTLFLDEISEMPLPLQVRFLRVLEDRQIRPAGGENTVEMVRLPMIPVSLHNRRWESRLSRC